MLTLPQGLRPPSEPRPRAWSRSPAPPAAGAQRYLMLASGMPVRSAPVRVPSSWSPLRLRLRAKDDLHGVVRLLWKISYASMSPAAEQPSQRPERFAELAVGRQDTVGRSEPDVPEVGFAQLLPATMVHRHLRPGCCTLIGNSGVRTAEDPPAAHPEVPLSLDTGPPTPRSHRPLTLLITGRQGDVLIGI